MGIYFARREKGINDFFLAGHRVKWWAAALSIFGTQLSAITFMAIPAKTYSSDWRYFIMNMGTLLIAAPLVCFVFIPFFRRLNVSTAYEYLENRFNLTVRLFASVLYVIVQLIRIGVVVYLPAIALATVTGINIQLCIILMGVLCIIYTVLGGIEAVIWSDVIQVIVLLAGAIISLIVIGFDIGSDIGPLFSDVLSNNKLSLATMKMDFSEASLIVVLLSTLGPLVSYTSDQTVVQRYLTTKDEDSAKASVWFNAVISIIASLLFFSLGTMLYMFFRQNPALLEPGMSNDSVFPWFILTQLPDGISGLLIAGIFAAAMSSLDSSMNSTSSAIINDFIVRLGKSETSRKHLTMARWLTVIIGIFGTGAAVAMSMYDIKSMWDLLTKLFLPFAGALCGLFMLGAFTRRANGTGALAGGLVAVVTIYMVQHFTRIHFFMYAAISIATVVIVGYTISILTGSNKKDVVNLTFRTLVRSED